MSRNTVRPLAGLATVVVLVAVVVFAVGMFQGDFGRTVPVTVVSERAGLVMNPQAKVKMRGVQVGQVASIETRSDGKAVLHLAMNPDDMQNIPSNALVDISSSTVFGAKSVEFNEPTEPSATPLAAGAQIDVGHVTVETNTVFQQLTSVLKAIDPVKLNQTLAAISGALNGRGEKLGQAVTDLDHFLQQVNPSLDSINRDLEVAPVALNAYADVAPDLVDVLGNTTKIGDTVVDQQQNLDAFLLSAIGLANTGNDVIGTNRQALTDDLRMLVPTTTVLRQYDDNLRCGIQGLNTFVHLPFPDRPGVDVSANFTLGTDRYRYPADLPKVAARSGSSCKDQMLPAVPNGKRPPYLVTDSGTNPWKLGNQGILLNSDALKQALFGPIDGPPRNSAQIGMPG
ncbi:virulence factor [Mycolicibacterium madagascariense]|uniref:Virulence factor n=1 Tax=Mycolicibacterium madagascariense TaxID=212765 RepID=A0A7I7XKC4_9MYCO|nr:MCE family protein [Mycolicibacterium madagascariense]MCV7012096.1 MCE family protein [Mycolicibacterium madagascariense]BBZ29605.1 virulence factor [Mycolicibacterium madagascariense]